MPRPKSESPPLREHYLSKPQVAAYIGVTTASIDGWLRHGKFPPPDALLPSGRKRWLLSTVVGWVSRSQQEANN
jgi:predicted DNA-binding transcriptional regulator AlpA